ATPPIGRDWHNRQDLSAPLTAVILAAGHGTRMRSRIPKVLHPICGRPMIDWVIEAVNEAGAKHVIVIANPHQADVAAHLDGRVEVVYQRDPKGTAHALGQIPAGELRGRQVLVVNGDSPLLTATSIRRVIDAHVQEKAPATIASVVDPTRDDGRVIRAADGSLERIVERKDATPEMRVGVHEFNVGLYCFDGSKLVEELGTVGDDNNAGEYYLTDVFLHLKPVTVVTLDDPREAMGVKDRVRLATAAPSPSSARAPRSRRTCTSAASPSWCGARSGAAPGCPTSPTWATRTSERTPTSARVRLRPTSTARKRTGPRSATAPSSAWTRCWWPRSRWAKELARGPDPW